MDLIPELEAMAANVVDDPTSDPDSEPDVSTRWQHLFSYTLTGARERVKTHRSNLSRERVSDAHWDIVRSAREAEGYDREAYEYSLSLGKGAGVSPQATNTPPMTEGASPIQPTFLLKLAGPLDTAAKAQEAAGLPSCPAVLTGNSDSGDGTFCRVNAATKRAILDRLSLSRSAFRPTFILISTARKDFSDMSAHPTLGICATLPQHRATRINEPFLPTQDQYPVWYFFYGSLSDRDVLARVLGLEGTPVLKRASVTGGVGRMWGEKYKALVDGPAEARVDGWAYRVVEREHEEALRCYETERYEVVRCCIAMGFSREVIEGLTFRFVDR